MRLALDLRHESWDGTTDVPPRAVRVDDSEADAPFRYVRFREPPYSDDDLAAFADADPAAARRRASSVFAYFRHEDEPTAPRYAERLLTLLQT